MVWPATIATAALAVCAISLLVQRMDKYFELREHEESGQIRLLFGLLRLLEGSPSGLVGTELKLLFCRHISAGFKDIQEQQGENAGFRLCQNAAEQQIQVIQCRAPQPFLPVFSDPERITAGHRALPRFMRTVEQLQKLGEISAIEARRFQAQLQDRHFELEADSCLLRADFARRQNSALNTQRHIDSAMLSLQQISCPATRDYRLALLEEQKSVLCSSD